MSRSTTLNRAGGFFACTAMTAALLSGCAGTGKLADAGVPPAAQGAALAVDSDVAIARAEARVAKTPHNGEARADLAQLYLAQGRFASAATTFEDAVSLGASSPKIGLSLALSYAGSGNDAAALATLDRFKGQIPAGDYGLAVALAGQPEQAVEILTNVVRGGDSTPKTRQNLAYAYALEGHWGEARVIAMQDVPASQMDARLSDWASRAAPEQGRARVAALLGTTPRLDPGQPAALALNGAPRTPEPALAATDPVVPAQVATAAQELPAVHAGESFWGANQPDAEPQVRTGAVAAAAPAPTPAPVPAAYTPAPQPVRQPIPPAAPKPVSRAFASGFGAAPKVSAKAVPVLAVARSGTHLVQLGAFTSRDGAERAKAQFLARNPALKEHGFRITEADVNGRHFFRVAAEGFDGQGAQSLCGALKRQGGACLAMLDRNPQPAAAKTTGAAPRSPARRADSAMLAQR